MTGNHDAVRRIAGPQGILGRLFQSCLGIDRKACRTEAEDQQMLLLSFASLWHWTQRADCTDRNLSISYWQVARVFAILGQAESTLRSAGQCMHHSQNESAFFLGYAHEAMARAAMIAGDQSKKSDHLAEARRLAAQVPEADAHRAGKGLGDGASSAFEFGKKIRPRSAWRKRPMPMATAVKLRPSHPGPQSRSLAAPHCELLLRPAPQRRRSSSRRTLPPG